MPKSAPDKPLTCRQRAFSEAVGRGLSYQQAARETGYSERAAKKLAADPRVQAVASAIRGALADAAQIDTARVLRELAAIVTADPKDIYGEDGVLLPMHKWPEANRRSVVSVEFGRSIKIKFASKTDAADKILRVLGAYAPEKHQHTVSFYDACLGLRSEKGEAA